MIRLPQLGAVVREYFGANIVRSHGNLFPVVLIDVRD